MKNYYLFYFTILLGLACSCTDEMVQFEQPVVSIPEFPSEQVVDSVYVNSNEVVALISKLAESSSFAKNLRHSRSVESAEIIPLNRDGKALAYIVNFPNESGFMIISGTKKYGPLLAYGESQSFKYNDSPVDPADFWLEAMMDKLSEQVYLQNDTISTCMNVWNGLLGYTNSCLATMSRSIDDYDMMELQQIRQDSIIEWSSHQDYEILNVYDPLTDDYNADLERWRGTEQLTYILYENEWEQLALGLRRSLPGEFVREESILTKWDYWCNSTFPYRWDENLNSYKPLPGSGALAAGQIMYYYRYPEYVDWSKMDVAETAKYMENQSISDFLYELGEESAASYSPGWTLIKPERLTSTITNYGYDAKLKKGLVGGSIPYIIYGKLNFPANSTPSYVHHYSIVSGFMSIFFEIRTSIYTFTGPRKFDECWFWREFYSNSLTKVDWLHFSFKDGYYDLKVKMPATTAYAKSFEILNTITIEKP